MRDVRAPVTYCADTNPAHVAADYELLQADPEAVDLVNAQDILTPTDVALAADGSYFVLDGEQSMVARIDRHGRILHKFGRSGRGPTDLDRPKAIAVDDYGNAYVAQRNGRIAKFSERGSHLGISGFLPLEVSDLVLSTDGWLYVASEILVGRVGGNEQQPYLVRLDTATLRTVDTVATVSAESLNKRPFLAANRSEVRLTAGPEGLVALWTPFDKYVAVYKEGELSGQVFGCMPDEVIDAYKAQRKQGLGFQHALRVSAGASFADARTLFLLSPNYSDSATILEIDLVKYSVSREFSFDLRNRVRYLNFYSEFIRPGREFLSFGRPRDTGFARWKITLPD